MGKKHKIDESWQRLEGEIFKIEMKGEYEVLCRDLNRPIADIV